MSPMTQRSPSVQAPASAPSKSTATPSASSSARRTRAAVALLTLAEKTASNPYLPNEERSRALAEAQRHLASAWSFLTSWSLETGADLGAVARAAELLGGFNRALPLVASDLRGPASMSKEAA